MDRSEQLSLKEQAKGGSVAALRKLLQKELDESLSKLKVNKDDTRYWQARTVTLEDIISLLPTIPE